MSNRNNQPSIQPTAKPEPKTALAVIEAKPEAKAETADPFAAYRPSKASGERAAEKAAFAGSIRQKLACLADQDKATLKANGDAERAADVTSTELALALVGPSPMFTKAEVSAMLGDVFGYRPKADGTPGATPNGAGGTIRKRLSRLIDVNEYVETGGKSVTTFTALLPLEDTAALVASLGTKGGSIFSVYKALDKLASAARAPKVIAFDPKAIVKIAESLAGEHGLPALQSSSDLRAAYGAVLEVLQGYAGSLNPDAE